MVESTWCYIVTRLFITSPDRLNTSESALQEAKFEVLSSEESYLRSLDMLAHRVAAMDALQDPCLTADHERDAVTKFMDSGRWCCTRWAD